MPVLSSVSSLEAYLSAVVHLPYVALDTETSIGEDLRLGHGSVLGFSSTARVPGQDIYMDQYTPVGHRYGSDNLDREAVVKLLQQFCDDFSGRLIFHNAKFDIVALQLLGVQGLVKIPFYDTMMFAHMLQEELISKELDHIAKLLLGEGKDNETLKQWEKMVGWNNIPPMVMGPYAMKDTNITYRIFEKMLPEMVKEGFVEKAV